jgi:S-adenosyl methyltransferase
MTGAAVNIDWPGGNGADREPPGIDTNVAHVARVYDWLLGGTANFKVDRDAGERAYSAWPGGIDGLRADVRAHRALLGRVVRHLALAGIRQLLDIGTGIPKENNVHEVAQREAPETRVVYVDNDPIVLAHAHQLLRGTPEGATRYIFGDLREPAVILKAAAQTLDFSRPVAVLLLGVLHFFPPDDDPAGIAAELMAPLAAGSCLALSHLAADVSSDAMAETFRRLNADMAESVVLRTREEVAGLFGGLELAEPGVVQLPQWRPEHDAPAPGPLPMWCGLGRKTPGRA